MKGNEQSDLTGMITMYQYVSDQLKLASEVSIFGS